MGKKIILAAILIFILVSVPLTIFLVNQRQETRMKAAPSTNLSLSPQSKTLEAGEKLEINVLIDAQTNKAISTSLSFKYDPMILEAVSINSGSFFQNPIEIRKSIDPVTGKIDFSFYTLTPQNGSGILASMEFTAKSGGISQVEFESTTSVSSSVEDVRGENVNNEINKTNGVYTVTSNTSLPITTTGDLPATDAGKVADLLVDDTGVGGAALPASIPVSPSPSPSVGGSAVNPSPSPTPTMRPSPTATPTTATTYQVTPTSTIEETLPVSGILENTLLVSFGGLLILGLGIFFLL